MSSSEPEARHALAQDVKVTDEALVVDLVDGSAIFRVKLRPQSERGSWLPPGQDEVACQVLPAQRLSLDWILRDLAVGDIVTVFGDSGPVGDDAVGVQRVGIIAVF